MFPSATSASCERQAVKTSFGSNSELKNPLNLFTVVLRQAVFRLQIVICFIIFSRKTKIGRYNSKISFALL
jgi:hypothetical protein